MCFFYFKFQNSHRTLALWKYFSTSYNICHSKIRCIFLIDVPLVQLTRVICFPTRDRPGKLGYPITFPYVTFFIVDKAAVASEYHVWYDSVTSRAVWYMTPGFSPIFLPASHSHSASIFTVFSEATYYHKPLGF